MKVPSRRSYTTERIMWILFVILVLGITARFLFSFKETKPSPVASNRPNIKKELVNRLCTFDHQDLASVIWSHRAHVGNSLDGSSAAVAQLLNAGIRNFDVDVSCLLDETTNKCDFMIAHPAALADMSDKFNKEENSIQTVSAFLCQIYTFCNHAGEIQPTVSTKQLHPLVTLEMKFDNTAQHLALVEAVQKSPLADRVAIIGADPERLAHILPSIKRGGVAAAYRLLPLTDHDYQWPKEARFADEQEAKRLQLRSTSSRVIDVPAALVKDAVQNTVESSTVATVEDATQSLLSSGQSSILQIYMPDIQLVTHPLSWRQHSSNSNSAVQITSDATSKIPNIERSSKTFVVAWVVDTPALMWEAFEKGLDGVISNNPVELLEELSAAYRYHCD